MTGIVASEQTRLLPAHAQEASEMALSLCDALDELGLTANCRAPDAPSIGEAEAIDLMSKAMGYAGGWAELRPLLIVPHVPVHLDTIDSAESQRLFMEMATSLSKQLGFDYAHGHVVNALQMSGVGYSPKPRRSLAASATPWGPVMDECEIADGIKSVMTGSHGGIILSDARQRQVPPHLRLSDPYYEEDCDWALVAVAFPDFFANRLAGALATLDVYTSSSVPRVRNLKPRHEAFLVECLIDYVPPDKDTMNRPPTPDEARVVDYLLECVRLNRRPVVMPSETYPTLQQWVACLARAPTVDGKWPMRSGPWRAHWAPGFEVGED